MTGLPQAVSRNQNSLARIVRDLRSQHGLNDIARNMNRIAADATRFLQEKWKLREVLEITPADMGDTPFPTGRHPFVIETVKVDGVTLPRVLNVEDDDAFGYVYTQGEEVFRTTEPGKVHRITYRVRIKNPADPASVGQDVIETHFDIVQAAIGFRALEFYRQHDEADRRLNVLNGLIGNQESIASVNRLAGRSVYEGLNCP